MDLRREWKCLCYYPSISLAQIILVVDALYAMVRVDWETHEGTDSVNKGGEIDQI